MKWFEEQFMLLSGVVLRVVAVLALMGPAAWWLVEPRFAPLFAVPDRVGAIERQLESLQIIASNGDLNVVAFKGVGVPSKVSVEAGGEIDITYVLRRQIDCASKVRVRFYSHDRKLVIGHLSYTINAVRSPVSRTYSIFAVSVSVPEDTPAGTYSYAPEIVPEKCGAYKDQVVPLSLPFQVTREDE